MSAPLLIFLNGGPGASSMMGLFLENGPLRVSNASGDYVISRALQSWADSYNMLYLDQPVGTGFSYGNTYLTDMKAGSREFISFILKFYGMYPEYANRDLYLTGESYAGKYLPLFTHDILEHNK
jgi:carboxypeptidase C (cathepsin A)